ncbi:MAG: tRNA-Thr(GGU) m(6)t(6)A37 methyltransferase TsaA [Hyphomicrobiaceae bacterium]|jgi:tRNA-Thr(GGU) m(6)t(6)A37 methyltransferase TsaA
MAQRNDFEIRTIGTIRTPWTRREDTPHQPPDDEGARGFIDIDLDVRPALADLDSFARIWLLFLFDRSSGWAPRVKPPRGGPRRGVLATRAPNRPSQIGMTNVAMRSVDVDAGVVTVDGVDLLDGTPIFDIKPYLAGIDSYPEAGNGWVQQWIDAGVEPKLKKPYRPPR